MKDTIILNIVEFYLRVNDIYAAKGLLFKRF